MNTIDHIKERFHKLQATGSAHSLKLLEQKAFDEFNLLGIPTVRHEEWKYTRINSLFNKEYSYLQEKTSGSFSSAEFGHFHLPGYEEANEIVFVNGIYSTELSTVRSSSLKVMSLEDASNNEFKDIVNAHLGHSSKYLNDGINALNSAFLNSGIFINVQNGKILEHPVYIYHITDAKNANVLAQPRSLVYVGQNAQARFTETYVTVGESDSLINQVLELIVEKDAIVEYYKIQNDKENSNQVSTTHIRQIGKSYVHTVTISLNRGLVRNNLNVVLEAEQSEAHLYGLYYTTGNSHIDNHTIVDNVKPNCFSNEFYKGILDGNSTGVFNGKIYVRPQAQKTNAYQSNKNILLSANSSVNTKPQLEIFADDVKCSHGCTIGKLDEEGMFYLQSRGINKKDARSLLLHSFAVDVLKHIKSAPIRKYVEQLISERLEFEFI